MTEVLMRSPDILETEIQFEQFDQIETVELLFPKLDGILLPIVIDNAEVLAPCPWMEGAEVSLTVALNNYYQLMTEENADEVIADVYKFLAGQLEPEKVSELELEPELDPTILIIQREEYVVVNETAEHIGEAPINIPPIHTNTELEAAPIASPKQTPVETLTTRQTVPVRRQTNVAVESPAKDLSRTYPQTEHQEKIVEAREIIQPAVVQDITLVTGELYLVEEPLALEVDLAPQVDHHPLAAQAVAGEIVDEPATSEVILPISANQGVEAVKDEPPAETHEIKTITIDPQQEPLRHNDEDSEMDEEFIVYDYPEANELPEKPDASYAIETTLQSVETDESEPSDGEIDVATQKINSLLTELCQSTEVHEANETDNIATLRKLANVIAELSKSFELNEDDIDSAASDELIEERLLELYISLLEDLSLEHTREFAHLLARLTLEPQTSREDDASRSRSIIHKKIKGLTIIVKKLKKAWNHVVAIGKLALRSHTIHEDLYSSTFFCICGERGRPCTGTGM